MGEQVAAGLKWGRSSVGRAPALQAGGQEFESLRLHCKISKRFYIRNVINLSERFGLKSLVLNKE